MSPELKQFIIDHSNDDICQLALQSSRYKGIDMNMAIKQIDGRQRIKNKVPLFYSNENIIYPFKLSLEQCSSQTTAIYKSQLCKGESLVDLTGGFGIDTYFISRNFIQSTYIEQNTELYEIAEQNFKILGAQNINVINTKSEEYLKEMKPVDVLYIDPARRDRSGKKVFLLDDCEPNIIKLLPLLLEKTKTILIKLSPMLDISRALKDLPQTKEVHVLSIDNECKEVIFLLNKIISSEIKISAVNFRRNNSTQLIEFGQKEEFVAKINYAAKIMTYLYEPNSSVLKAGAFNLVAEKFNLFKLHNNTHLYTSNELKTEFPGRIFKVESVSGTSKNDIRLLKTNFNKANVTVRNFPLSVEEFRIKTGIREGGDIYIFACKMTENNNVIIICNKK